jgi:hemerythrin
MNENLLLGIPTIDIQHQELFNAFGKLAASGDADFPEEVLSDILSRLGEQIQRHFATEEALMLQIGLPEPMLSEHRAAHELILEEFAQIHLDAMFGQTRSLPEIIGTVTGWVQRHLVQFDLPLKPYIAAQLSH